MPNFANPLPLQDTPTPPPGVLAADYFDQPPGYQVHRPGGTRDWLIAFTIGGQGCHQQDERRVLCGPGDVTVLLPETAHDYATAGPEGSWQFYWAHFIPRPFWLEWLDFAEALPGLRRYSLQDAETTARVERAFQRMASESRKKGELQEELAENALEEALILIHQEIRRRTPRAADPRVDRVQRYLEENYHQPLTLDGLAELVALSPWRLSHLYKAHTGQSITESLARLRLRQAARLLGYTARQVAEIAQDVGFQSPYHFSRQFKRVYGVSPQAYRKQHTSGGASPPEE